ncbi:MAG: sulfatase [Planctomycetota bacterium]
MNKNWTIAALVIGIVFGVTSCRKDNGRASGGAANSKHPNIIVLTVDTLRADHMALYGYNRNTMPAIEEFAKSAVVFDQAVVSRGNTRASYASMLTGLYPFHHGVYNNNTVLHENFTTLPELLEAADYNTAAFVSNFVLVGELSGCDQGFDIYDDKTEDREINRPNYERSAGGTLKAILQWLENDPPQPFCLFTNFIDPHGPYLPPEKFRNMYKSNKELILDKKKIFSYQRVNDSFNYYDYVDRYDGEIRYVDEAMSQLIDALKNKGLWDDAIVIFLSDHGESLGEHNIFFEHQYYLYEETVKVPLAIRLPRGKDNENAVPPRRVSTLGSPMDIIPTILDYLGISYKGPMDGQSLLPVLNGNQDQNRTIFLEFPEAFQPNTRKLLGQVIFDVIADPLEQKPIRYDENIQIHRTLSRQLDAMLKQVAEYQIPYKLTFYDVPLAKRTEFVEKRKEKGPKPIRKQLSDEQIEKLKSLGYIQ